MEWSFTASPKPIQMEKNTRITMKQYLSPEQTAKLIELGFEKPKNTQYVQRAKARNLHSPFIEFGELEFEGSYTIGELIEMLPEEFDGELLEIAAVTLSRYKWVVRYPYGIIVYKNELIDALYEMIIKLREEGVYE